MAAVAPTASSESFIGADWRWSAPTELLDDDAPGRAVAEGNTGPVDLANERSRTSHFGDEGRFAEAHFAHSLAKIRFSGQFADPTQGPSGQLA